MISISNREYINQETIQSYFQETISKYGLDIDILDLPSDIYWIFIDEVFSQVHSSLEECCLYSLERIGIEVF